MAQIAVTAMSLSSIGQVHWTASGLLVLSLTSALMAVYYATTQQRTVGRLLHASQIRLWIRGGRQSTQSRIVPDIRTIVQRMMIKIDPDWHIINFTTDVMFLGLPIQDFFITPLHKLLYDALRMPDPCEPQNFDPSHSRLPERNKLRGRLGWNAATIKQDLATRCFTPSASSVITLSAPQILLSMSLMSLIIALGIYLGFRWTLNIESEGYQPGKNANRNIFIMYIVGLGTCIAVYSVSRLIQDQDIRSEPVIIEDYVDAWARANTQTIEGWGYDIVELDNGRTDFVKSADVEQQVDQASGDTAQGQSV